MNSPDGVVAVVAVVTVVVVHAGRVLLLRRAASRVGAGIWETVSGRLEVGEEPFDAADREVREETGLRVSVEPRPVDVYVAQRGERAMLVVVFRGQASTSQVVRSDEHDAHEWLGVDELGRVAVPPRLRLAIERALNGYVAAG